MASEYLANLLYVCMKVVKRLYTTPQGCGHVTPHRGSVGIEGRVPGHVRDGTGEEAHGMLVIGRFEGLHPTPLSLLPSPLPLLPPLTPLPRILLQGTEEGIVAGICLLLPLWWCHTPFTAGLAGGGGIDECPVFWKLACFLAVNVFFSSIQRFSC